eukprot:TRINITY_DN16084_c0_g1_i1.p1 TRINITY_DN16084_c0_g1~~TRINITY_DN16084_c0_g1_i1.p1  ORF type:complete len:436 (+),score=175.36 TRINITY_DN16084_c0_g1_i1:104-1309(+)
MGEENLCYNCKKPGHFARECPDAPKERRQARGPSNRDSILKPPVLGDETGVRIVMVKGRCYRQPVREVTGAAEEEMMSLEAAELNMKFDDLTNQYVLNLRDVRPEFYRFIIGSRAATLQKLEKETGCSIAVPKTKREEEEVGLVIRGLSEQSVLGARGRIEYIVESSREKLPYTHFLSIPLDMASLQPRVSSLLQEIRTKHCGGACNIEPAMVQKEAKLHLTVLMLRLYGEDSLKKAAASLRKCQTMIQQIFTEADKLHVLGVDCMNDDPTQVHVAYLKIVEDEVQQKLLDVIDQVSKEFILAGLCTSREAEGNKLLHATIVNSLWRRSAAEPAEDEEGDEDELLAKRKDVRVPFDMTPLFEAYESVDLGKHKLMRMEVSVKQAEKGETGYYKSLASIPFP